MRKLVSSWRSWGEWVVLVRYSNTRINSKVDGAWDDGDYFDFQWMELMVMDDAPGLINVSVDILRIILSFSAPLELLQVSSAMSYRLYLAQMDCSCEYAKRLEIAKNDSRITYRGSPKGPQSTAEFDYVAHHCDYNCPHDCDSVYDRVSRRPTKSTDISENPISDPRGVLGWREVLDLYDNDPAEVMIVANHRECARVAKFLSCSAITSITSCAVRIRDENSVITSVYVEVYYNRYEHRVIVSALISVGCAIVFHYYADHFDEHLQERFEFRDHRENRTLPGVAGRGTMTALECDGVRDLLSQPIIAERWIIPDAEGSGGTHNNRWCVNDFVTAMIGPDDRIFARGVER